MNDKIKSICVFCGSSDDVDQYYLDEAFKLGVLLADKEIRAHKARMHETADAFISLPGGIGTMDELFETITWAQINLHNKPIGLLNTKQFYDPVAQLIDHLHAQKFIYDEHKILIVKEEDPETLLERIFRFEAPDGLDRWMSREG